MYAEATKVCNGPLCNGKEHPLSEFYRSAAASDGLQSSCMACQKYRSTLWKKTPKGIAYNKKYSKDRKVRNPAANLFQGCAVRAKKKGMECSLTIDWIQQKLLAGVCEVTGIAFVIRNLKHPFQPSIDRIDSSQPYTPDNCRVVLWIINTAKHTLAEDDFQSALRQVAEAVVERC